MNILPDVILILLVIIAFVIGYKKGFVRSVWKIAALALTIVFVTLLKNPMIDFLSGTQLSSNLYSAIAAKVHVPAGGGVNVTESLHLPGFMQPKVESGLISAQNAAAAVNDAAAMSLTRIIITIAACVILFIVIRLILMALFVIINGVSKAPVINGANKLMGGLLGAVNIIFIIFLLLSLFTMFAPADSSLYDMINQSYIAKYLYNYNILLQIFMKI